MPGNKNSGNRSGAPRAPGGGRKRVYAEFRRDEWLLIERQTPDGIPLPAELGRVLNVDRDEVEIQLRDETLITIRRPDPEEIN